MPEGGRECAHGAAEKLGHPGQPVPAPHPLLRGSSHLNTSTDTHRYRDSHTHGDGGYMVSENVQWPMGTAVLPADHTVALGTGEPLAHSSPAARSHLGWQPWRGGGWQSCFVGCRKARPDFQSSLFFPAAPVAEPSAGHWSHHCRDGNTHSMGLDTTSISIPVAHLQDNFLIKGFFCLSLILCLGSHITWASLLLPHALPLHCKARTAQ